MFENNNKITRRTAIKSIGLTGIAVGGIMMGTNCCSPKKEDAITYNEKDIIPCNALNCEAGDCDCKSNNTTNNSSKSEDACCSEDKSKSEDACCESSSDSKCICKPSEVCPAGIDVKTNFLLYNECVREGNLPVLTENLSERGKENLKKQCRAFLSKMNKIPKENRAELCTKCGSCIPNCKYVSNIQEQIVYIADFIKQVEKFV